MSMVTTDLSSLVRQPAHVSPSRLDVLHRHTKPNTASDGTGGKVVAVFLGVHLGSPARWTSSSLGNLQPAVDAPRSTQTRVVLASLAMWQPLPSWWASAAWPS